MDTIIDFKLNAICDEPILCRNFECEYEHSLLRTNNICSQPHNCMFSHCDLIHAETRTLEGTVCFLGPFCKSNTCPNKKSFFIKL